MDKYREGDKRTNTHAEACSHSKNVPCKMSCRCWCHGITKHLNVELRANCKEDIKNH